MVEIVSSSDVLGGKPRINGTRVSAEQVYEMYSVRGLSVEEIAEELPTINVAQVEEAVRFMEKSEEPSEAVRA